MSSNEGREQTRSLQREYSRHALKYSWKAGGENTGLFFCLQLAGFAASAAPWKSGSCQPPHPPATVRGQSCRGTLSPNSQKPCLRDPWATLPKKPLCRGGSRGPSRETHLHLDIVVELLAGGRKGLRRPEFEVPQLVLHPGAQRDVSIPLGSGVSSPLGSGTSPQPSRRQRDGLPEPFWSRCDGDTSHRREGPPASRPQGVVLWDRGVAQADLALTPCGGEGCGCWVVLQHGARCLHRLSAELSVGCRLSTGLPATRYPTAGMSPTSAPCLPPSQHPARQPLTIAHPLHQSLHQALRGSCKPRGAEFRSRARRFGPFGVFLAGISEHGDRGRKPRLLLLTRHFHARRAQRERAATCCLPCPRCPASSCRSWNSVPIIKHE